MNGRIIRWSWAKIAMVSCCIACLLDMATISIFARFYPGYNSIVQPVSVLGAAGSPIARIVSLWWVFIGLLFLLFAFGYGVSNHTKPSTHNLAAWLIGIYAVGDEIGSGVFPGDHLAGYLTATGWIHNIVGGIGMAALMVLPPVLMKKFTLSAFPILHSFCIIITAIGSIIFLGFTVSHISVFKGHWFASSHGLWQSLWIINYYVFLMVIAVQLVIEDRKLKSATYKSTSTA
jgi:hypothetical protein